MPPIIETLTAAGSAFLLWRRVSYLICWAAGNVMAAQAGIRADEKQAYEMGRSRVMQTLTTLAIARISQIDWRAMWAGALVLRDNVHEAASIAWRGLKRDVRLAWDFVRRKRKPAPSDQPLGLLQEHGNIASVTDMDVAGLAFDLEQRRATLARNILDPAVKTTIIDAREHDHISRQLTAHYAQNPAVAALFTPPAPQGLLGGVVGLGASKYLLIALAGSVALLGVQSVRVDRVKADGARLKASAAAMRQDLASYAERVKTLRVQVTEQNVLCVQDQARAADVRAKQEARQRSASLSAKKRIADASRDAPPVAFDLDAALRGLREPARDPQPSPAGTAGADHLAGAVLLAPAADAGAAASGAVAGPSH